MRCALTKGRQEKCLRFAQNRGGNYCDDIAIPPGTGLRESGLRGLTRTGMGFDRRCIHDRRQLCRMAEKPYFVTSPKTKNAIRNVPMTDVVYAALVRVMRAKTSPRAELPADGHSGLLFPDKSGMPKAAMPFQSHMRELQARFEKTYGKPTPRIAPHVPHHNLPQKRSTKRGLT